MNAVSAPRQDLHLKFTFIFRNNKRERVSERETLALLKVKINAYPRLWITEYVWIHDYLTWKSENGYNICRSYFTMIYEIIRSRDLNAQFANDSSTSMEQLLVTTFAFRFRTGSLILTDKQRNHWKQSHQPCIWPIVSSLSSRSIPETKIYKKNTFERGKRRPVETHQWINQSVSWLAWQSLLICQQNPIPQYIPSTTQLRLMIF